MSSMKRTETDVFPPEVMAELEATVADDRGLRDPAKMGEPPATWTDWREEIWRRLGDLDFAVPSIPADAATTNEGRPRSVASASNGSSPEKDTPKALGFVTSSSTACASSSHRTSTR